MPAGRRVTATQTINNPCCVDMAVSNLPPGGRRKTMVIFPSAVRGKSHRKSRTGYLWGCLCIPSIDTRPAELPSLSGPVMACADQHQLSGHCWDEHSHE